MNTICKLFLFITFIFSCIPSKPSFGMEAQPEVRPSKKMDEGVFLSLIKSINDQDYDYFEGIYESLKPSFSISRNQMSQLQEKLTVCVDFNCNHDHHRIHHRINTIVSSFSLDALLNSENNLQIKDINMSLFYIFSRHDLDSLKKIVTRKDFDVNDTSYFTGKTLNTVSGYNLVFLSIFCYFKEAFELLINIPNYDPNIAFEVNLPIQVRSQNYTILELLANYFDKSSFKVFRIRNDNEIIYYIDELIKKGGCLYRDYELNNMSQILPQVKGLKYGFYLGDVPSECLVRNVYYYEVAKDLNIINSKIVGPDKNGFLEEEELWGDINPNYCKIVHNSCSICLDERWKLVKLDCCNTAVCADCCFDLVQYKLKNIGANPNLGKCEKCSNKISISSLVASRKISIKDVAKLNDLVYRTNQMKKGFIPCPGENCNVWTYPSESPRWFYCGSCGKNYFLPGTNENAQEEESRKHLQELLEKGLLKLCPLKSCSYPIEKTEGCNHMKCSRCGYEFNWETLEKWN